MRLERAEWLGDKDGKRYYIDTEDERVIIKKEPLEKLDGYEQERRIANEIDDFEDGYNDLEQMENGDYIEVLDNYWIRIERKAYLIED